jgi:hypothetical protein
MTTNRSSNGDIVTVSDWNACYNSSDNVFVVSCIVASGNGSASITGVGLLVNNLEGNLLASFYNSSSSGSETVYPAFNLPPGKLSVGDVVWGIVQGECDGQHFFTEQELTIVEC